MANTSPHNIEFIPVLHPIKTENFDIFLGVISLLARILIFIIDRATLEVPMQNIWKKLSVQFLRYTPLHC